MAKQTFTATGTVQKLALSGIGPNSGEITLAIMTPEGEVVEAFGGVMSDAGHQDRALESGVFAGYLTLALGALNSGRPLTITYQTLDIPRISGMSIDA